MINHIENDIRKQHFRFIELLSLYNKSDCRRQLVFEDEGYVDNIDLFLTGCMSYLPVYLSMDGSTVLWQIINGSKKFKTLLDFVSEKIPCQGKYWYEIEGFQRDRIMNKQIIGYVINPSATHKELLIKFLQIQ